MCPAISKTNVYGEELGDGDGDVGEWSSFKLYVYGWKLGRKRIILMLHSTLIIWQL